MVLTLITDNHMKHTITIILALTFSLFHEPVFATKTQLTVELDPVRFVIPAFNEVYSERESTLAPEEYELAEELKALLANKDFQAVSNKLDTYYDIELSPALLTLKAQVYFTIKAYDKAEATYLSVLKRKPQFVRVHEDLGQLYLITQQLNKAQKHFSTALSLGSSSALIHGQLGYLNLQLDGAFSAIYAYQKALTLEPRNPDWQQGLLTALLESKMFPSALALLNELIKKHPKQQSFWLTKAAIELETKDFDSALISLEYSLLLGDVSQQNLQTTVQLHLRTQSFQRAITLIDKNIKENDVPIDVIKEYLYWLNRAKLFSESERILSRYLIKTNTSDVDKSALSLYRAAIYAQKNQVDKAIKYFNDALDFDNNNASALIQYAHFLMAIKQFVDAESLYLRAQAFESTNLAAMLGRAQIYINTNDIKSAHLLLIDVSQKYPDTPGIKAQIEIIENLVRANNKTQL